MNFFLLAIIAMVAAGWAYEHSSSWANAWGSVFLIAAALCFAAALCDFLVWRAKDYPGDSEL